MRHGGRAGTYLPYEEKLRITRILTNGFAPIRAIRGFLFRILTDHDKRSAANSMALVPNTL